jgi:tetratricopeptide (TPR) repeat protein
MAWRAFYEYDRKAWHKKGIDAIMQEIMIPWIRLDPENIDSYIMQADIYMRYNKPDKALPILEKVLDLKPKCEPAILGMVNCYRVLAQTEKDEKKKSDYLNSARGLAVFCKNSCLSTFAEAQSMVYTVNAEIPIPK